jgi:hypothetical protein
VYEENARGGRLCCGEEGGERWHLKILARH